MDERHASALYELAPEEFVAAREALAKELVAEGDRAAAKEVRALRRPTVVAWAANQLVRRHPQAVESLLAAGGQLRAAQEGALGGAGGAGLREAMGERRAAL
ncbi:MAG: hypothetical protein M3R01_03825, partial [Actinomycetota bacterium]|nr:hypothetical protein [Actinomycetota bacterium]